jgi:hypothetical protein
METTELIKELELLASRSATPAQRAEGSVLALIANANLFLAVEPENNGGLDTPVLIKLHSAQGDARASACVFATTELLTRWCQQHALAARAIAIGGGALRMVIPQHVFLEIDPGTAHWVTILPEQLARINTPLPTPQPQGAADDFDGFRSVVPPEQPRPARQSDSDSEQLDAAPPNTSTAEPTPANTEPHQPAKKRFFARGSPTTLFQQPQINRPIELNTGTRSYTNSTLKKVVRPQKPGDGEKE